MQPWLKKRFRNAKVSKQGMRLDLGMSFRSSMEANTYRYLLHLYLNGDIYDFKYEPKEFEFPVKRGNRFYRPDFMVQRSKDSIPEYWEIKGWMDKDSQVKLNRMKKYFPDVKVIVLQSDWYRDLAKTASKFVQDWE